jgi:large conductance mechanosensitive channel
MLKGFKDFLMRGNVVDLAVAVVIGTAFAALITQFTKSFIEPLIKLLGGGGIKGGAFTVNDVAFDWAAFVNAVILFLIVAAAVYFFVVVPMNRLLSMRKRHEEPESESPSPDVLLLTEIRDLLRAQGGTTGAATGTPVDPGTL